MLEPKSHQRRIEMRWASDHHSRRQPESLSFLATKVMGAEQQSGPSKQMNIRHLRLLESKTCLTTLNCQPRQRNLGASNYIDKDVRWKTRSGRDRNQQCVRAQTLTSRSQPSANPSLVNPLLSANWRVRIQTNFQNSKTSRRTIIPTTSSSQESNAALRFSPCF